MKNKEFVSVIVNSLNRLSKDTHISKRYILSVGVYNAKFLLSQKLTNKSLFKKEDLFRTIHCFPLQKESSLICGELDLGTCSMIMKSKNKLSNLIYGRFGSSIFSVTTIDGVHSFHKTTKNKYFSQKKRPYFKYLNNKRFFYEEDGYIYLPDSEIEMVSVTYIPFDESEVENQSECEEDCDGCKKNCDCKSIWDFEFMCSDDLLPSVIQSTINTVSIKLGIPTDENPNMDENIKSKTIN